MTLLVVVGMLNRLDQLGVYLASHLGLGVAMEILDANGLSISPGWR